MNVLPDVEFGPIRNGKHPYRFSRRFFGVVEMPEFGPLFLRVPAMRRRPKREYPFLSPALLFVAARTAECDVEVVQVECLFESLGFPKIRMQCGTVVEGIYAAAFGVRILIDDQLHAGLAGHPIAKFVHGAEFPRGVDMQQREGWAAGMECFARQVQHHSGILAHRVKHHGLFGLGDHFAHDMNGFGFQALQMRQRDRRLAHGRRSAVRRCHGRRVMFWQIHESPSMARPEWPLETINHTVYCIRYQLICAAPVYGRRSSTIV